MPFFIIGTRRLEEKSMRPKNVALVAAIASSGLTGRAIASTAGIHPATLSRIICYRCKPEPETIRALCRALKCQPAAIGLAPTRGGGR